MKLNGANSLPIMVVGAGISGLTAANLLTRNGFPVTVLEASDKVGGCCATTTMSGYTFNDGAVFLGIIDLLDHAFTKIGLSRSELLPLRKIIATSSTTLPDGTVVTLREGCDLTVSGRVVDLNRAQRELHKLIDRWRPVLRFASEELLTHPFSSLRLLQKGWRHVHKFRGTVASECNRLFTEHAVKSALSGALLYSGMPAEKMPVLAILGLVATLTDGLYLPEGGIGRVPEVLKCALTKRGVAICFNSPVQKILIENGRACGVQMTDGARVDAAAIISTASGMSTFGSMMDKQHLPASIVAKLRSPRLSHRAVSIQFGLSNRIEAPAHSVSVLPWMENQQDIFMQDGSEVRFPVYSVPTVTMPELAPHGGSIIEMFYPVRQDIPVDHWDEGRKEQLTALCFAALRQEYDPNITITRVRSPKDFQDSMHLFAGALYGLSPAATPREQFPHVCPIPGLFLAGQTTFPGYGVGTAMMSGIFAAEALAERFTCS